LVNGRRVKIALAFQSDKEVEEQKIEYIGSINSAEILEHDGTTWIESYFVEKDTDEKQLKCKLHYKIGENNYTKDIPSLEIKSSSTQWE